MQKKPEFPHSRPMPSTLTAERVEELATSFRKLNRWVMDATEQECEAVLVAAAKLKVPRYMRLRIFGRFNALRGRRERREYLA